MMKLTSDMTHYLNGYTTIGLVNPKTPANVGSVMRACGAFGGAAVYYTGQRFTRANQFVTDPQKHHLSIPLTQVDDLRDAIPCNCVPVAVEFIKDSTPLNIYAHPERAFYIFGPEDSGLGKSVIGWCRDVIHIPTTCCLNLAATVNVVLWDRMSKRMNHD